MLQSDRLPSLSILRCFEASAKHESFTAAAEELRLTQSAVSRQVRELEEYIGTDLFRREGRGVRLTDAGRIFAESLLDDLMRLRSTVRHAIAAGAGPQVLVIAAPPTFATRWLVPRLPQFRRQHPDVEVVIYSRSTPFDLHDEHIDVAVHFGGEDWPGARLTPLCPEKLVVVAAPALVADNPKPDLSLILDLPLLHFSSRPHLWENFARSCGMERAVRRHGSHFDQMSLIIAAAMAGMGAAILPTYLIEDELAHGRLTCLSKVATDTADSYFVVTPLTKDTPLVASFSAWLCEQVT